jgi:hypothetical protein
VTLALPATLSIHLHVSWDEVLINVSMSINTITEVEMGARPSPRRHMSDSWDPPRVD